MAGEEVTAIQNEKRKWKTWHLGDKE